MSELKSGWNYKKLDELGFVGRGRSRNRPRNEPSLYEGPYPFFQTGDVKAAELYLREYSQTYNEKGLAQSKLWEPGTLLITIAANIAESAILGIKGCFPDSIVGFIADPDKSDVHFVKYALDTLKLQMQSISRGTTQDNLSLEKLLSIGIPTPSLPTQHKIAAILSAYDDLIENNTRRIALLERMAQLLYREWFVRFRFPGHEDARMVASALGEIPEGWEVVKLGDIAKINRANLSNTEAPEVINYVNISSVSTGKIDLIETMLFADAPGRARRIVQHGDIIWSTVRPNRKSYALILNPTANLIVSTGFAVITPVTVPYTYLYHAVTTDEFAEYLTNHATGSAYPAVNTADFENADILLPPPAITEAFHRIIGDFYDEKQNLHSRNIVLRRTRDLLLPRLIAGEVDVLSLTINT